MKKLLSLLFLGIICITSVFPFGCGGTGSSSSKDGEQTLEVFIAKVGYGSQWAEDMLDAFKEEDWVKEKYPNLNIIFESSGDRTAISTRIQAGEGKNSVDLIIGDMVKNYIGKNNLGKELSVNLTDTVYNTYVPGEDVKVIDKINPYYKRNLQYYDYGESPLDVKDFESYSFTTSFGAAGLIYNEKLLKSFGYVDGQGNVKPPRTTDELVEACTKIKNGNDSYKKGYAIMAVKSDYISDYLLKWWGQYEGIENFSNFQLGISGEGDEKMENSVDIFRQKGREEALNAMIQVFSDENGFVYDKHKSTDFKAGQRAFMTSNEGVFLASGDWLNSEMEDLVKDKDAHDNCKMMKFPIISSITNKTKTIKTEEKLRQVIDKIDAGFATAEEAGYLASEVSEEDYNIILQARGIGYANAGQEVYIPIYAEGKDIACDFLRFFATDKAQKIYGAATKGGRTPFFYDFKNNSPELYSTFSELQKSIHEMSNYSAHKQILLPYAEKYPLFLYGQLTELSSYALNNKGIRDYATAGSLDPSNSNSAKAAFDRDIEYWTANNNSRWKEALSLSGYNN